MPSHDQTPRNDPHSPIGERNGALTPKAEELIGRIIRTADPSEFDLKPYSAPKLTVLMTALIDRCDDRVVPLVKALLNPDNKNVADAVWQRFVDHPTSGVMDGMWLFTELGRGDIALSVKTMEHLEAAEGGSAKLDRLAEHCVLMAWPSIYPEFPTALTDSGSERIQLAVTRMHGVFQSDEFATVDVLLRGVSSEFDSVRVASLAAIRTSGHLYVDEAAGKVEAALESRIVGLVSGLEKDMALEAARVGCATTGIRQIPEFRMAVLTNVHDEVRLLGYETYEIASAPVLNKALEYALRSGSRFTIGVRDPGLEKAILVLANGAEAGGLEKLVRVVAESPPEVANLATAVLDTSHLPNSRSYGSVALRIAGETVMRNPEDTARWGTQAERAVRTAAGIVAADRAGQIEILSRALRSPDPTMRFSATAIMNPGAAAKLGLELLSVATDEREQLPTRRIAMSLLRFASEPILGQAREYLRGIDSDKHPDLAPWARIGLEPRAEDETWYGTVPSGAIRGAVAPQPSAETEPPAADVVPSGRATLGSLIRGAAARIRRWALEG